jgi:thiamine pyrophosphate-dependent acetolactate synthase large subunit-like protein
VDIDASEHNKNRKAHLPVVGDIKDALTRLNKMIAKRGAQQEAHALARPDRRVEEESSVRLRHHGRRSPTAIT